MKILSAKYVITMSGDPIFDGAVAIENDEIIDVGTEEALLRRYPNAEHEDYAQQVIMPGLINCFTQFDMSLYRDFPSDPVRSSGGVVNYIDWLIGCFNYRRIADHAHLREAVEWGADESIQAGTTCVADMSTYEGVVAVMQQKNIRAVVFPEVVCFDSRMAKDLFESALAIIEKYRDYDSDFISVGAGPYSPFTLSRNVLRIISQYSRSSKIPLMMHAAESFSEMEFFYNSTGDIATKLFPNIGWGEDLPPAYQKTPIQYLAEIGFLEARPQLIGCLHATHTDLDLIAKSGSRVVITPRASQFLQQGVVPFRDMFERKIPTLLGTSGIPSVNNLSLWDEMRAFMELYDHHIKLTGRDILAMVTTAAAEALHLQNEIGSLEKGKKADLIILDMTSVSEQGDLVYNLIRTIRDYHVRKVIIGGKIVKSIM